MTKGKKIFIGIIVLIIVILTIIKIKNIQLANSKEIALEKPGTKSIKANALIVEYATLTNSVSASGSIIAQDEVILQSEVSGRIIQLNINEGAIVNKGALLVKLNDADLKAQLQKAFAQLKLAQSNLKRLSELLNINGVSQADYDIANNQVYSLQAEINVLQVQIDKTEIRAPFTGKLGLRNVSLGAFVSPTTTIATLQNISQLKLDINIPERYAYIIKPGDLIDFNVDGTTEIFKAKVLASETQIDESTRNLKVRAVVLQANSRLIPGVYVKVNMKLNESQKAIMIPSNTIIPDDKANKVIVVKNGKAQFVSVYTGLRSAEGIEIVEGLQIGDTVLTSGLLQAKPNMLVKVTKIVSTNTTKQN